MAFYSATSGSNTLTASVGDVERFYVSSSRPNPNVHTITYSVSPPYAASVQVVPDTWNLVDVTMHTAVSSATITATITDQCTGTTSSKTIDLIVNQ